MQKAGTRVIRAVATTNYSGKMPNKMTVSKPTVAGKMRGGVVAKLDSMLVSQSSQDEVVLTQSLAFEARKRLRTGRVDNTRFRNVF